MPADPVSDQLLYRDGASQAQRTPAALDPAYVSVDEQSIRDLLAFARVYAKELRYVDDELNDSGDWSAFLDGDLDTMVAYLQDPQKFEDDPETTDRYSRPHLTLFLTFLELLKHAQTLLNDLTRRHLEFYYRQALRLTLKQAVPDHVHVLVELARNQDQAFVPAGSLLLAGQDSQGADLFYKTDHDLVANRARVASLKSLFAQKQVIGIPEVHQAPDLMDDLGLVDSEAWYKLTSANKAFIAMMRMALGERYPGDTVAAYPVRQGPSVERAVDAALFEDLDTLLHFIQSTQTDPAGLYLYLPVFRALMQLKQQLKQQVKTADGAWAQVNEILMKAGQAKGASGAPVLDAPNADDFVGNLDAALAPNYDGLPDVDTIYDLYRRRHEATDDPSIREDILNFIETDEDGLHMSLVDFDTMMEIVEGINQDWQRIYDILRAAGRKKQRADPEHKLLPVGDLRLYDENKFATLVKKTLGTIVYPAFPDITDITGITGITGMMLGSLDDCYAEVLVLETCFYLSVEDFAVMRQIYDLGLVAQPWEWEQVYAILEGAHKEKVLALVLPERRAALKNIRIPTKEQTEAEGFVAQTEAEGFEAMITFALGDPEPGDALPDEKGFMELDPVADEVYIRESLYLEVANFQYIKKVEQATLDGKPTEEDWDNVYTMLERAQRRKRGWQEPRAEIEQWQNLYAAADATEVQVRLGLEDDDDTPRWRTFGEGYNPDEARAVPATIGFAVASPVLALAEGARTITLKLGFSKNHYGDDLVAKAFADPVPFRFFLSTEEEMVEVAVAAKDIVHDGFVVGGAERSPSVEIILRLDEQAPPIAPLAADTGIQTPWPVLQILLTDFVEEKPTDSVEETPTDSDQETDNDQQERLTKKYSAFQNLVLEKVDLQVEVSGITQFALQNDAAVLDAKKPFEPFSSNPVVGSSFYFAHPELCAKRLDMLGLEIDWMGVPDDLADYYAGYEDYKYAGDPPANASDHAITDNASPQARLKLYDNRAFFEIDTIQLFHAAPGSKPLTGTVTVTMGTTAVTGAGTDFMAELVVGDVIKIGEEDFTVTDIVDETNLTIDRNASATASADPAHVIRNTAGASQTNDLTIERAQIEQGYANAAYDRNLELATGDEVLDWSRYWQVELMAPDFQHAVYPQAAARAASQMGISDGYPISTPVILNPPYTPTIKRLAMRYRSSIAIDLTAGDPPSDDQLFHLEPFGYREMTSDAAGRYLFLPQFENEGELYIGLSGLAPPQNLSLLYQLAEGSADPDLGHEAVYWSYLSGNLWHSLEEGRLLTDTTNGLLNSGILTFDLGPVAPSTVLPPDQYWIRATITQNSRSVGDTVAIRAQAVSATFADQGNAPDHLSQPLPPERITGLADPQPEVKAIEQPYSSIGGKGPEEAVRFYTRASERLRHKNRALTSWDYERMILEAFPDIYKVKCLPVDASKDPRLADLIQIVVIPDIRGKLPFDPFEPKAPSDTLFEIEQYLHRHTAPLARFTVKNPRYAELKVRFKVQFRQGYNPGFYLQQLHDELRRYLAPWAYDDSAEIVFGGRISAGLIVNFVEERPYVDYLGAIRLYILFEGKTTLVASGKDDTLVESPDVILVSARQHEIELISEEGYEEEFFVGIDYMKVELDFTLAEE